MIAGNDGGACVSFNGGNSWTTILNQLTSQFYRIDVDDRFPYCVYATQQDNSSIGLPSASEYGAIPWSQCFPVGTGESGDIAVHPEDDDIVYIGAIGSSPGGMGVLQRYNHKHQGNTACLRVAGGVLRTGAEGSQIPLQLDLPDRVLSTRFLGAVRCRQPRFPHDR